MRNMVHYLYIYLFIHKNRFLKLFIIYIPIYLLIYRFLKFPNPESHIEKVVDRWREEDFSLKDPDNEDINGTTTI